MDKIIALLTTLGELANRAAKAFTKTASEKTKKAVKTVREVIDHIRNTGRPKW